MKTRVIVTGHSSGLGSALAQGWLEKGAEVVGISRRHHPQLAKQFPQQLREISLDLADPNQLLTWLASEAFAQICSNVQQLWLFNCAGVQSPAQRLGAQDSEEILHAINLNVSAVLMLSNTCYQKINTAETHLAIVHISSGAAHKAYAGWSIYGATKAALDQHARCVRSENNPNLSVVSLAPGVIDTPMQQRIRDNKTFPIRERFLQLHSEGNLQDAATTAQQIIAYCQSQHFAGEPVVDIRNL